MKTFLIIFGLLALALCQDLYEEKSDVVHLTQSTFDTLVTNTNDIWLVEFYGTLRANP